MKTEILNTQECPNSEIKATYGVIRDANSIKGLADLVTIEISVGVFDAVERWSDKYSREHPDYDIPRIAEGYSVMITNLTSGIVYAARDRMSELLLEEVDIASLPIVSLQALLLDCESLYGNRLGIPASYLNEEFDASTLNLARTIEKLNAEISRKTALQSARSGYVYLLKSASGFWKIGRTANPKDRLKTFSIKLPFEVEFEHLIPCDDMVGAETELHRRFADRRINGEWFRLNETDVAWIKTIKSL